MYLLQRKREERVGEKEGARCDSCAVVEALVPIKTTKKRGFRTIYFLYSCIQPMPSKSRETEQ